MLGNLFENEEDDILAGIAASTDVTSSSSEKGGAPPHPRPQSKLAGIANQGATCYLNSLLQTLLLTPEFRESLFQLPDIELGRLEDRETPGAKVRVIPLQLQRLFIRLLLLNQQSVSTAELTESFGWTNNEQFQQHDVQELNRILFSAIEDSLAGTSGHSLIQQLYHGNIVNQIICEKCGKISEREEDFLDLTLTLSSVASLENGLKYSYCDMELMDGKNQYRCERCQKLVNAKKGAKIRALPQILTISLLRFSYDFVKMERFKETGKFTFPMELDMSPYVEKESSCDEFQYELFSVVIHRGGAYGGHYHAYIRDIDSLGHWVSPGKEDIEIASDPKKGVVELVKTNSPGELIEIILQKNPDHAMPVDQLGNEISKQTGVTWNKRFKRNHGSLTKYLSKCEGNLVYNPHTRYVSLIDTLTSPPPDVPETPETNAMVEKTSSETTVTDTDTDTVTDTDTDTDNRDRRKPQKPPTPEPPPEGYRWFNFDDSRVSPINPSEIERHFQGRESAYMLFYRRKQAQRSPEAFSNPAYCVPDRLLHDVLIENDDLDKRREEYESSVNTIHLQLHFESDYQYKEGALKVRHVGCRFTELTIDRRKTVADLLVMVREVGGNLVPDKLTLHRMRDLPAGLHLYDCISDDSEKQLMSLNIDSKTKLFVWDGDRVDGGSIPTGVECEPIYLTIVYGNPSQFSCGYPKNITFGDLRSSIRDLTGIAICDLSLKKLVGSEANPEFKSLNDEDVTLPLAVLSFRDGDNIIAADKNKEDVAVMEVATKQGNQFSILVENRCVETQSRWSKQIEATKDMTIGELKVMAMSAFGEEAILDGGRLRIDNPSLGLRPPLHEQQTVAEANLSSVTCVVLEPGKAPESNQITLSFTPYDPKGDLPDMEVTVEKILSVRSCMEMMIQKAEFTGDDWHLRNTNWFGEPAEVLDDLDLTLDKSSVNDGDRLLLLPGRLPPKGFLRLPINLYPTPDNPRHSSPDQKGMIAWITSGIQGLLSSPSMEHVTDNVFEPLQVGEIEISKDATLEDLKLQVMTLPALQDMPIPTLDFLRLSLVDNHRPGMVLKGLTQTLRRLKVTASSRIAIQILPQEESLGPNEVIVNICERLPGTLTYSPEQEFIWDVSRGATPQDFKQCVADFLIQPIEQIVIAKHFSRQYKWLVVETTKSQPTNQKGRKKRGGGGGCKTSMRQAPYHLQDGDVIGVKTIQGDPDNSDDFSTEADVKGREEAQKVADEKKKMREERKKAYEVGPSHRRRPEVALTIKVDSFT